MCTSLLLRYSLPSNSGAERNKEAGLCTRRLPADTELLNERKVRLAVVISYVFQ